MDNRFQVVSVIPNLCNWRNPVEEYARSNTYLLILDERFRERFWMEKSPQLIAPERRKHLFKNVIRFDVGLYPIDAPMKKDRSGIR
jgi:hypothetical protein